MSISASPLDASRNAPSAPLLATRPTNLAARGEPMVWLSVGGLTVCVIMILGLLLLILVNGTWTFWPRPLAKITASDGKTYLGEITRTERFRPGDDARQGLSPNMLTRITENDGWASRRLIRVGNFDLYGNDFYWIPDYQIVALEYPAAARIVERKEWGPFFGTLQEFRVDGKPLAQGPEDSDKALRERWDAIQDRREQIRHIEKYEISEINYEFEAQRLKLKQTALEYGKDSPEYVRAKSEADSRDKELNSEYDVIKTRLQQLREEDARYTLLLVEVGDRTKQIRASDVVRTYTANQIGLGDKLGIYFSRWGEFLTAEPREANTEGGVFPAIFGTVMMTILMSLVVGPFGVIAAVYLHEYAKQGAIVSTIRIAVGNLAGVPSIVYGIFGVGFFCYGVGGLIDHVFYPERLPSPTFGTTGILWSSLTLALLTLPVVIVASEEALAAVPSSMREGSYGCGASKWQTIRRIVLPKALPGIMTGLILAMARGAGEVAPLMITGAVKLAPELPFDSHFPYFHLQRSFMHLGFHIYDVGFQSRNSEAAKPMVYTTTLLLIALVILLNLAAMVVRAHLKRKYKETQF